MTSHLPYCTSDAEDLARRYVWEVNARREQLPPDGEWSVWLILAGRGFGKALDLSTAIPTPSGWTRLGDIAAGDAVFDESGRPCRVTAVHEVPAPEVAYRLHFSDGTSLDACSDHQWVTWTHAERKSFLRSRSMRDRSRFPPEWPAWRSIHRGPQVRTTQAIVDTFTHGTRGDTNHCVPTCGPLELPDAALPIDPYVLGAWLGNGASASGDVFGHEDDLPHVRAQFERAGIRTTTRRDPQAFGTRGLHAALRAEGLLHAKRVPAVYLRASAAQRLALLQGLMDSDGGGSQGSGQVEFCNTNHGLARAVVELARSLGQKPVIAEGRSTLYGVDKGPKWRVTWRPTVNVFRLPRKLAQTKRPTSQGLRNHHRMIVRFERIGSRPMRCLTVDSPHSMFLAGEAMIPTHNTRSGAEWVNTQARLDPNARIALVGRTVDDVRDTMVKGESGIIACSPPWFRPEYVPSVRALRWPNGAIATTYSADKPDQMAGPQHTKAWCFIAGTLISTARGDVPIESVVAGDLAWTRRGLRRVTATGHHAADVGRVRFSTGATLTGTGDHPVLTPDGWTSLDALAAGQTAFASALLSLSRGAHTHAVNVAASWDPAGVAIVHNVSVEGEPEYFANGILVHNCDEAALWRYSRAWDQLMFGLRLGARPQVVATTTPRATPWLRALVKDPSTRVTRGSTYDNASNLAPLFLSEIRKKYEGTRLGRQELRAELLEDVEGALWTMRQLDAIRLDAFADLPAMRRTVVAVDPSESANASSAEAGVVVCGMDHDGVGYALEDRSGKVLPSVWARRAIAAFYRWNADEIVAEMNAGGEMVRTTIRSIDPDVPVRGVYASKSKHARAEPVSALYEQGRIRHRAGLVKLESQMTEWDPSAGKSPDRIDALVHGMTRLFFGRKSAEFSERDNDAARTFARDLTTPGSDDDE